VRATENGFLNKVANTVCLSCGIEGRDVCEICYKNIVKYLLLLRILLTAACAQVNSIPAEKYHVGYGKKLSVKGESSQKLMAR
jgi:hypothetical protein